MAYRVKLTTFSPEIVKFKFRDTFRVKIVASDGENMPDEIFLFQKTIVDPHEGASSVKDEFLAVCSPFDLSIYPANEPDPTQDPPFFRKNVVDILLPGVESSSTFISSVQEQVCNLISLLEKLDVLNEDQVIWCPSAPDESSSSSSSEM